MIVTKASYPSVYNHMLSARRTSLIQAALVVQKAEAWVMAQKNQMAVELQEISVAKEKSHGDSDLNVIITKQEEQVMARHNASKVRLQVFESALGAFKARIIAANSSENLAGLDMTPDNNYQSLGHQFSSALCPMPGGRELYEALDSERTLSYYGQSTGEIIMASIYLGCVVGCLCGIIVCPWLLLLIPAAIIVGIVIAVMVENPVNQIQLDQPVFSDKELTALLEEGTVPAVKVSVSSSSMFKESGSPVEVEMTPVKDSQCYATL